MATENYSNYNPSDIPSAKGMKFGLVVAEFNSDITENLFKGARETLIANGVQESDIIKTYVPGSFELPLGAQLLLEKNQEIDAIICIGCIIQGETKHFDYVCQGVTHGIQEVALKYNKPVIFCVLTDQNKEQSIARSGGSKGNKGTEGAIAAIKMLDLKKI